MGIDGHPNEGHVNMQIIMALDSMEVNANCGQGIAEVQVGLFNIFYQRNFYKTTVMDKQLFHAALKMLLKGYMGTTKVAFCINCSGLQEQKISFNPFHKHNSVYRKMSSLHLC